jgi:hypothetical protein
MLRFTIILAATAAMTCSASADYILRGQLRAPCHDLPPLSAQQEPTAVYMVETYPQRTVERLCAGGRTLFQPITACAIRPTADMPWRLLVSSFLSKIDRACVLLYEKAHLPPNNWQDQAWEDAAFKGVPYKSRRDLVAE